MRPPHDRRLYAIVFAIVLQCFPSPPSPWAGWNSHSQATALRPAVPRGSSPSPALPTLRVLRARAPVRAPAARHVPLVPWAVLHGTPLVDPTTCPPPRAPDLSTMPIGPGSRPRLRVLACPRLRCRHRASVQGCAAGVLASLLEHGVRTYGRRPAYLRETIFARSLSATSTYAFETLKKTVQQTPHTVSCVGHMAFGRKGAPP